MRALRIALAATGCSLFAAGGCGTSPAPGAEPAVTWDGRRSNEASAGRAICDWPEAAPGKWCFMLSYPRRDTWSWFTDVPRDLVVHLLGPEAIERCVDWFERSDAERCLAWVAAASEGSPTREVTTPIIGYRLFLYRNGKARLELVIDRLAERPVLPDHAYSISVSDERRRLAWNVVGPTESHSGVLRWQQDPSPGEEGEPVRGAAGRVYLAPPGAPPASAVSLEFGRAGDTPAKHAVSLTDLPHSAPLGAGFELRVEHRPYADGTLRRVCATLEPPDGEEPLRCCLPDELMRSGTRIECAAPEPWRLSLEAR